MAGVSRSATLVIAYVMTVTRDVSLVHFLNQGQGQVFCFFYFQGQGQGQVFCLIYFQRQGQVSEHPWNILVFFKYMKYLQ
jgi:hypothetical protein